MEAKNVENEEPKCCDCAKAIKYGKYDHSFFCTEDDYDIDTKRCFVPRDEEQERALKGEKDHAGTES